MRNIFLLLLLILLLPGYAGAAALSLVDGEVHVLDFNQSGDRPGCDLAIDLANSNIMETPLALSSAPWCIFP